MHGLLAQIRSTIQTHRMFDHATGAVLAVSGGPDSLALMHALAELRASGMLNARLHVGHLHHGMRGDEADADARFVHAQATRLDLPCTLAEVDVPRKAREESRNEEDAGRAARYGFLRRLACETGATHLVTGHHADDQAETVLMRAMRGAGPRGLAGIPYVRLLPGPPTLTIVRPLLDCGRRDIEQYLEDRGLTGRLDRTNLSPKYLRNRLRHGVLPKMAATWRSDLRNALLRMGHCARRLTVAAANLADALDGTCAATKWSGYLEADADALRAVPSALRAELLRRWLEECGLWRRVWDRRHFEASDAVLFGMQRSAALPGDVVVEACGRRMVIAAVDATPYARSETPLAVPGQAVIPLLRCRLSAKLVPTEGRDWPRVFREKPVEEEYLDWSQAEGSLTLRFPRPGDRMTPLGAPGERKLQDIFTDRNVPRRRRARTPLLADDRGIVWIAGHRIAERVRLTERSRTALRLRLIRGE